MTQRRWTKWVNLGLAVVVGGGMIWGLSQSVGSLPAFAQAFNPSNGVWTTAKADQLMPKTEQLVIPGVEQEVRIVFEKDGTPHIKAATNRDAWLAVGYLHAKFRLFQMDLTRRQGAGLLAEVFGSSALESDQLQRQLGLQRTAQAEWDSMAQDSPTKEALEAYAKGVNLVIDDQMKSNQLPLMFKFLGYQPEPWKPQDSLLMKGVLAQMMSLTSMPVMMALLNDSLGYERMMELFPVLPPNEQRPYDTGSYQRKALETMPLSTEHYFMKKEGQEPAIADVAPTSEEVPSKSALEASLTASVLSVLSRFEQMPPQAIHEDSNSNAWVVGGQKTESGKPLLAGDPHLNTTMPSIWYQLQVDAPDYQFAGVTVPGVPFPLIGHNEQISWSLTNGQSQQSFFYKEQMDESRPDQYYWQGAWRKVETEVHTIPVKGQKPVEFEVKSTVHGPIMNKDGQTLALNWLGSIPSQTLDSLRLLSQAKNYSDFESALVNWKAPTMNFAYADQAGNIAMRSSGYHPVFAADTKPWLPMRGDGKDDIQGSIPFADLPHVLNPPNQVIGSANQRQVKSDYPYYIGNTMTYDPGYRANRIYEMLESKEKLTWQDMAKVQADVQDSLAANVVPKLLEVLAKTDLSGAEQDAVASLSTWNYQADADSVAASLWWTFWDKYMHLTLDPWWEHYKVPTEYKSVRISPTRSALNQVLEVWTVQDQQNPFFTNPLTGEKRDATGVMQEAFRGAVADLQKQLGDDVSTWRRDRIHTRKLAALAKLPVLGYGPVGAGGNHFTLNVASELEAVHGPSWRMITDWGTGASYGSYPGGQSENPISPWYTDRIESWWNVQHLPMIGFSEAEGQGTAIEWTFQPVK